MKTVSFHFINTMTQALRDILVNFKHSDRAISHYVRTNSNWKTEERALFTESVYDITRNRLKLEYLSQSNDLMLLVACYLTLRSIKLPPRNEFKNLDLDKIKMSASLKLPPQIEYSIPNWLYSALKNDFESEVDKIIEGLSRKAPVYIRRNRIIKSEAEFLSMLKIDGIAVEKCNLQKYRIEDAFKVKNNVNIFASQAYKLGMFEMQDIGSQAIGSFLDVMPTSRVIDTCAGSGGKSLLLSQLLDNGGELIALDVVEEKLRQLEQRASKIGLKNIKTRLVKNPKSLSMFEESFDRVLVDSPCSGTGVLRRNPDTKWNTTAEKVNDLNQTQLEILQTYAKFAKVGGDLVYSTCSLLKSENEEQIAKFKNSDVGSKFEILATERLWPHLHDSDGFFMCKLRRTSK